MKVLEAGLVRFPKNFFMGGEVMMMGISKVFYGSAILVAILAASGYGQESGTIDFDTDPGLTLLDPGGRAASLNIRSAQGVADIVMNRESGSERLFLALDNDYVGNSNNFKGRVRFAVRDSAAGTDIEAGFFASDENNMGDSGGDSAIQAVIEGLGSGGWPARWFGGGGGYDRGSMNIEADTWYVYDFEFQPVPETATLNLYQGDGSTLIHSINGGNTSGISHLNQVGFGNLDCCDDGSSMEIVVDWMTYAANSTLPADPAYAPDSAIIPEPASVLLFVLGSMACGLCRKRVAR